MDLVCGKNIDGNQSPTKKAGSSKVSSPIKQTIKKQTSSPIKASSPVKKLNVASRPGTASVSKEVKNPFEMMMSLEVPTPISSEKKPSSLKQQTMVSFFKVLHLLYVDCNLERESPLVKPLKQLLQSLALTLNLPGYQNFYSDMACPMH